MIGGGLPSTKARGADPNPNHQSDRSPKTQKSTPETPTTHHPPTQAPTKGYLKTKQKAKRLQPRFHAQGERRFTCRPIPERRDAGVPGLTMPGGYNKFDKPSRGWIGGEGGCSQPFQGRVVWSVPFLFFCLFFGGGGEVTNQPTKMVRESKASSQPPTPRAPKRTPVLLHSSQ